jgi:serine/threonine protein kinase
MANRPSKDYFLEVTTSELARIFLQRALEFNPDERASLEELSRHAFLRSVYCPKEIPESAFFTPPTFHNDSKRQQEEHSAKEDEHVNKKVMTQSSAEATGNSQQAKRKEAVRGFSKRDEQCDITIEIESLRAKKQQAEEEVNVAVMKLIEVEAKLAVKEKQRQEKCKDLVSV